MKATFELSNKKCLKRCYEIKSILETEDAKAKELFIPFFIKFKRKGKLWWKREFTLKEAELFYSKIDHIIERWTKYRYSDIRYVIKELIHSATVNDRENLIVNSKHAYIFNKTIKELDFKPLEIDSFFSYWTFPDEKFKKFVKTL